MKRIQSLDILRGASVALMILVNNPGSWAAVWEPLRHASWNGLLFADLVFPIFLFVMGVSMYFSLHKGGFKLSWKILKRVLLLIGIGLILNWISGIVWANDWSLTHLRYTGVLQRFGLSFGLSAVLVCTLPHKSLPWISAGILALYAAVLLLGNGYAYGPENGLARADRLMIPEAHLYNDKGIDPEGLVSTLPCLAHTLVGFLVGKLLYEKRNKEALLCGIILLVAGLLATPWLPLNKKIWSPSFVLVLCGIGTLVLCLLYYLVDERGLWKHYGFFKAFGTNAIFCYVMGSVVAWVLDGTGLHGWFARQVVKDDPLLSAAYALACVLLVWLSVLPLYKRKIFLKL